MRVISSLLVLLLSACGVDAPEPESTVEALAELEESQLPLDDELPPPPWGWRGQVWETCGDPVCSGWSPKPGIAACTGQLPGDRCAWKGAVCDPGDACNALYTCRRSDPTAGGCPISRAAFKSDISYVDAGVREALAERVLSYPLATWQYRHAPGPTHVGFLIDDVEGDPSVAPDGDHVDLYGYTSMAVAALQVQQAHIDAQQARIEALEARLAALEAAR